MERVNSTMSETPAILPHGTNDELLSFCLNGWPAEENPSGAESENGRGRLPNPHGFRGGGDGYRGDGLPVPGLFRGGDAEWCYVPPAAYRTVKGRTGIGIFSTSWGQR